MTGWPHGLTDGGRRRSPARSSRSKRRRRAPHLSALLLLALAAATAPWLVAGQTHITGDDAAVLRAATEFGPQLLATVRQPEVADAPRPHKLPVHGQRRVAVCFFGLMRGIQITKDSIRSRVLDVFTLNGWEVDVFLHTYLQGHVSNPRSGERNATLDVDAWRLLAPDHYELEDPEPVRARIRAQLEDYMVHGDPWRERPPHHSLRNLLLQLHSLQRVTTLWAGSGAAYDLVVYLRPDMWYFNEINMTHAAAAATQERAIYVPYYAWWGGVNDRIAFGHPKAALPYGNRLAQAKEFAAQGTLHAERFVKYVLDSNGLQVLKTGLLAERVRSNGVLWGMPRLNSEGRVDVPVKPHYRLARNALGAWGPQACGRSCA